MSPTIDTIAPRRRPGLVLSAFDPHTNEVRSFELPPFVFSPCRWATKDRKPFTATGWLQVHIAGVAVGSERDGALLRKFDVLPGDVLVRGQDDRMAVLTKRQFLRMCVQVEAAYDEEDADA